MGDPWQPVGRNWQDGHAPPHRLPGSQRMTHAAGPAHGGRVRWTAVAPPGALAKPPARPEPPYTGPPAYPAPPRWGFPNLIWRRPTSVPGTPSGHRSPTATLQAYGLSARVVLVATAVMATLAAGAELWRYALLVQSRNSPLSSGPVLATDVLVVAFWLPAATLAVVSVIVIVQWLPLALREAFHRLGAAPPRSAWNVALAILAPWLVTMPYVVLAWLGLDVGPAVVVIALVLTLALVIVTVVPAGPVVAELEHAALGRPPEERPKPSLLVLAWWAVWAINPVIAVFTARLRLVGGIQAQADGVLLTALTELTAAALAVLTFLVIRRVMLLLAPAVPGRLRQLRLVTVHGAPEPPLRAARPAGARR